MHLIGQKVFTILRMLIFPATEICAELCCQSTWGYLPQLSATFEPLLLYVAYLSSCFGNSKMVTECEPKPISMNFGSPRRGGFMCGRHGAGLDWPEEKHNFSNNILLIFAAIKI